MGYYDLLTLLALPVLKKGIKIVKSYQEERNLVSQFLDELLEKYQRKELIQLEEIKDNVDALESIANAPRLETKPEDRQRAVEFIQVISNYLKANYSI